MAPALCLPLPPVLARCCALHLFEDARKVISIAHAAFLCDNLNVFIAESQKALCLRDAQLHQVTCDRLTELLFKNASQVEFIDVKLLRQSVQCDLFPIVGVKIVLDLLQILPFCTSCAHGLGVPAFLHQQGQQGQQLFTYLHVAYIIVGIGQRIQGFQQHGIGGCILGAEAWLTAALLVLFVDGAHVRAVKMHPAQLPQVLARIMAVRLAAVKKCAVTGAQGASGAIIFQGAAAALHHEEQVGGQPLAGAGMGAASLQPANLL